MEDDRPALRECLEANGEPSSARAPGIMAGVW